MPIDPLAHLAFVERNACSPYATPAPCAILSSNRSAPSSISRAQKVSPGVFVFPVVDRATEQPEARSADQTSESSILATQFREQLTSA
jgi:hypothetical protein